MIFEDLAISCLKHVAPSIFILAHIKSLKVFLKITPSALGALGRRFESCLPDSNNLSHRDVFQSVFYYCLNSVLNECGQIANKNYFICHDKPRITKQKIRYSLKTSAELWLSSALGALGRRF